MRSSRGFGLVEVVVALGLMAAVGTALLLHVGRVSQAGRAAESGEAAAALVHAATLSLREGVPEWLPQPDRPRVTLTTEQIRALLNSSPSRTYADPGLYREVSVERQEAAGGLRYVLRVCLRLAGEEVPCPEQTFSLPPTATAYVPPGNPGGQNPPTAVRGLLQVNLSGPGGSAPDVELRDASNARVDAFTAYGTFNRTLPPATYTLRAAPTAGSLYTYRPDVTSQAVTLRAGQGGSAQVSYVCQTGAARVTVVRPEGSDHPDGDVRLGAYPVPADGTLRYLSPGPLRLSAQPIRAGAFTYDPTLLPGSDLSVAPCATASATVSYRPVTGALEVEVDLPDGVAAAPTVSLDGPARPSRSGRGLLTFADLPPGDYGVLAPDVLEGGIRYRAAVAPNPAAVAPGEVARAAAAYRAVSGRLRLEVRLPGGAAFSPRVRLSGPSGFARSFSAPGAFDLDDLSPGGFTLEADNVAAGDFLYGAPPSPRSLSVSAGQTAAATVSYAPLTGVAEVRVEGLPDPALAAKARFAGEALPSPAKRFTLLSPGVYPLEAEPFTHEGYSYAPDAASQAVGVAAGAVAEAVVRYARQEGAVRISLSGLPAGAAPDLALTLPSGQVLRPSGAAAYTGMPTGGYRLAAADVTHAGITYRASVAPRPEQTLEPGGSVAYAVSYAAVNGTALLQTSGLPPGVSASVTVSGPGYSQAHAVAGSAAVPLNPGSYTAAAAAVARPEGTPYGTLTFTYAPPPPAAFTVAAGQSTAVPLPYARAQADVTLRLTPPPGLTATATLLGPGGFSQTLTAEGAPAARAYAAVPAGAYEASAPDLRSAGVTYKAAPAAAEAAPGGAATLELAYQPATAALAARATGLPPGLVPTVYLRQGGSTVAQGEGAVVAFADLAPGAYDVVGGVVFDAQGWAWRADPAAVALAAGDRKSVDLAYLKQSGTLNLSVSGLPAGCSAALTVSGPSTQTLAVSPSGGSYELGAGDYTLSPADATCGGFTYRPTASPASFSLAAGGSASVGLSYVGQFGRATFTLSGLPGGATAAVTLSGPGGSRAYTWGNGAQTLDLLPGSYTAAAADVAAGGYTYRAAVAPAAFTVGVGTSTAVSVPYAAATGALTVTVSAPAGMPAPTVRVYGPGGGLVATLTSASAHALANLAPGTYTLQPADVTDGNGFVYKASGGSVSVTAGATASAAVSYVKQAASLTVTVLGLPAGATATVSLAGPTARSAATGNGSVTFTDLPLGAYSLAGSRVVAGGYGYTASGPGAVNLASPGAYTASLGYTVSTGRLRVVTSGLPPWRSPSYPVSGPAGLSVTSADQTFDDVPPGAYTATPGTFAAADPSEPGAVYRYSAPNASASVSPGGLATLYVAYSGTGTLRLSITSSQGALSPHVSVAGSTHTALGTYYLNYLSPGSHSYSAQVRQYAGVNFSPSPASGSVGVAASAVTALNIVYVPENRSGLIVSVYRQGGTSDARYTDATVPSFQVRYLLSTVATATLSNTPLTVAVNSGPTYYYTGSPAVGTRVEFASSCNLFGCWERLYWELASVTGLPLANPTPGQAYYVQAYWKAVRCGQEVAVWVCRDRP